MYINWKPIDEIDLLEYGRHFIEMESGEFYLHAGDAVQTLTDNNSKVSYSAHEIVAMSSGTKTVPIQVIKSQLKNNPISANRNKK